MLLKAGESILLLKEIIRGLKEKNALLEENKKLLLEKIHQYEKNQQHEKMKIPEDKNVNNKKRREKPVTYRSSNQVKGASYLKRISMIKQTSSKTLAGSSNVPDGSDIGNTDSQTLERENQMESMMVNEDDSENVTKSQNSPNRIDISNNASGSNNPNLNSSENDGEKWTTVVNRNRKKTQDHRP